MFGVPVGFNANGNIAPRRFVEQDGTVSSGGGKILQAGVGGIAMGISAQWEHNAPWYPLQDGYCATAGMNCATYLPGQICYLSIADTVVPGTLLKPDTDGKGVEADTDKDWYGAMALECGVSGNDVKVLVMTGYVSKT